MTNRSMPFLMDQQRDQIKAKIYSTFVDTVLVTNNIRTLNNRGNSVITPTPGGQFQGRLALMRGRGGEKVIAEELQERARYVLSYPTEIGIKRDPANPTLVWFTNGDILTINDLKYEVQQIEDLTVYSFARHATVWRQL